MKKIICTVTNDLNFDQRMIRVCTSLSQAGYDVQLIGRKLSYSQDLFEQPYRQKRFKLIFNKGKIFYLEFNIRLFFYLMFEQFDAVCSIDLDTLLAGYLASKIKKRKIIYDAHEYFTEVPEVVERPITKGVWEALANFIIPRLKFNYTVSTSIAAEFQKKYNTRFSVILNVPFRKRIESNIDFEEHEFPFSQHAKFQKNNLFILIYQGVLNEGRGLEEMIEAMEEIDGAVLWLAGEGDISEILRKLVDEKKLQEKVIFFGRVAPGSLHKLTVRANLGLNLLKNKGLNYYFSLANKTFDYMQAGIPSICMDFPEYKQINEKYSTFYLLKSLSKKDIVAAVNKLRDDNEYYIDKCKNARMAAKVFNWEKEETKLIEFYRKVFE
ncbi:MAG: glycosyltransferase [Bacteroidota bacterium]